MSAADVRHHHAPRLRRLARKMRPMLALVALAALAEAGVALLLLMHLRRGYHLELGEIAAGLSFAPNPAGLSLGRAMGIYESATLLGATIGAFVAGQLYGSGGGWRVACFGAAMLLIFGALVVRSAVHRVGVAEFPVEQAKTVSQKAKPAPESPVATPQEANPVTEPANKQANGVRNWLGHLVLFLAVQVALAIAGFSWPVEVLFHGPHDAHWIWNSSGHWLLNLSRIWCFVLLLGTVWIWGRELLRSRPY